MQPVNLHRRDADLAIRMVKPDAGHLTLKRLGTVGFGVYGAASYLAGADGLSLSEADFVGVAGDSPAPAGRPMDHAHPARATV